MKRLLTLLLCLLLIAAAAASCAPGEAPSGEAPSAAASAAASAASEPANETRFPFQRKVCSSFMEDAFGKPMCDAWFALVDAVYEGKTEFACPDAQTFRWVTGQFPTRCHPAIEGMLTTDLVDPDHPVRDGMGHFSYTVTDEERVKRLTDFEAVVEEWLNAAMRPDMTDFEKALALYRYYAANVVYDYDAYEKMYESYQDQLVPYRTLTEKTGVCQDISFSYSYLLMQAGVDAGVASGHIWGGEGHQWSMIRLNGRNYHIDPTFVLGSSVDMSYFLMTDAQREATGLPAPYTYVSGYTVDHPVSGMTADDDTFRPLWSMTVTEWDEKAKTLRGVGTVDQEEISFRYEGY